MCWNEQALTQKRRGSIITSVKAPAENRWHAQESEKSSIKELLTKVWAGSRETTEESAKAWASAVPGKWEGRRAEWFPEPGRRGLSGKDTPQTFGLGVQPVLSATTDRAWESQRSHLALSLTHWHLALAKLNWEPESKGAGMWSAWVSLWGTGWMDGGSLSVYLGPSEEIKHGLLNWVVA